MKKPKFFRQVINLRTRHVVRIDWVRLVTNQRRNDPWMVVVVVVVCVRTSSSDCYFSLSFRE